MYLFFILSFIFSAASKDKLNLSSTPSINQVLEIKYDTFIPVLIDGIKAFKIETVLKNTDKNSSVENILLKLNIFNKRLELIGSKIVKVDFTVRKPLTKRKSYLDIFISNIKNFSFTKQNLRKKMKDKIAIEPLQSKNFMFYFYNNDINVKLNDLIPNSITINATSAELKK